MSRRALHLAPAHPHPSPQPPALDAPPLLLRVSDVCHQLGLSRSAVQRLLATGVIPSVRIGRSRRVVAADLQDYVTALPSSAPREDGRGTP